MRLPILLLAALAITIVFAAEPPATPNLVQNAGFETKGANGLPDKWDGPAAVYSQVSTPVHTGAGALQYANTDASRYVLCSQVVPLKPGKAYSLSVWVKTEAITGNDTGATLCLEWSDADGKWLGGAYPGGVKGATDWTQIKSVSGRVPANAARCTVACYVRKGMTGKAWFDDVEVKQWLEPPLQTMLLKPNYRGQVTPETKEIELAADLMLDDYDLKSAEVQLKLALVSQPDGQTVREATVTPTSAHPRVQMAATGLAEGKYELRAQLVRKADASVIGTDGWRIVVPNATELAKRPAYIDEHNRLIVNGKPFFPLGMYFSSLSEPDLKTYSDSAFNCVMPYGAPDKAGLDLAQQYGQKVIYSVKDVYVGSTWAPQGLKTAEDERAFIEAKTKAFKDHPALLAWYLNDELPIDLMPRLEAHQQWLEDLDPGHPTWVVLYQVNQLALYRKTFDVLGTDPYPIPGQPARMAADWTKACEESVMHSRPVWQVPQAMTHAAYAKTEAEKKGLRSPTLPELRSMSWQCITEGASGLIYYSWFDLKKFPDTFDQEWAHNKQVAAEIKEWVPTLLSVEPVPPIKAKSQDWLHWTTRQAGNVTYLFVVNDEEASHETTFEMPKAAREVLIEGQEKPITPEGTTLPVRLGAFEVKVYKISL